FRCKACQPGKIRWLWERETKVY
ncbi:hypothetical protein VN97_g13248, partial [Penicillium thymicola]